jgi:hypothetical protein
MKDFTGNFVRKTDMSGFDDRQKGMEAKHVHEEQMKFKASVKRNKLLGLWAADQMGMAGEDAEQFAKDVIKSDFEEAGDDDVLRMVQAAMAKHGVEISSSELRAEMDRLMAKAMEELS